MFIDRELYLHALKFIIIADGKKTSPVLLGSVDVIMQLNHFTKQNGCFTALADD